jgi:hypothetical protein
MVMAFRPWGHLRKKVPQITLSIEEFSMARVEATISDVRGRQVSELAKELGLTRSQVVDEALSLYLTAAIEARRGLRIVLFEPSSNEPVREIVTPSLSQLEWTRNHNRVVLRNDDFDKVAAEIEAPSLPNQKLKKLMEIPSKDLLKNALAKRSRKRG